MLPGQSGDPDTTGARWEPRVRGKTGARNALDRRLSQRYDIVPMGQPTEAQRLEKKLSREMARAVAGFRMLRDGDKVMVAVSGGKDSLVLLHLLLRLARRAPVRFSVVAVHLDQGQPGHDPAPLVQWFQSLGCAYHVEKDDTFSAVRALIPEGKTPCSLCARLRRAVLYRVARELGCTRIALGHHRDDAIVTLLMNLVYEGQLKSMPAKLVSDDGENVVIRPLIYCAEADLGQLAERMGLPILPCGRCGVQPDHKRKVMARWLEELERTCPSVRSSMIAALANVRPSHLLDSGLWKKLDLEVARDDDPEAPVTAPEPSVRP